MDVLTRFLNKIGVKSYDDLNQYEKETYRQYEVALSGRKLTDDDVKEFLSGRKDGVEDLLEQRENSKQLDTFLKMELKFIRAVEVFLDSPRIESEATKKMVEDMIDNTSTTAV